MIKIFTDGGSRGNPGLSATGIYIVDENDNHIFSIGNPIGITTNNVAEYSAVVLAFEWMVQNRHVLSNDSRVFVFCDSLLLVSQLTGLYRVKHPNLIPLYRRIKKLEQTIQAKITYSHIPREKNKQADKLVNMALDKNSQVSYNGQSDT